MSETMTDLEMQVWPYLQKLAAFHSASDIKDFLVSEKIFARQAHPNHCAIAAYLHRGSGQPVHVSSRSTAICGWNSFFNHTTAMRAFIRNFDEGEYPELGQPDLLMAVESLAQGICTPAGSGADFYNNALVSVGSAT